MVLLGGCNCVARCCYGVARWLLLCCYGVVRWLLLCCYGVAKFCYGVAMVLLC